MSIRPVRQEITAVPHLEGAGVICSAHSVSTIRR
jgi:hypothetical protein